jgi:CBS domain-containing protein
VTARADMRAGAPAGPLRPRPTVADAMLTDVKVHGAHTTVREVRALFADLAQAGQLMLAWGRRRLAVVDRDGKLQGLLCLKRSWSGFCSNRDVRARSAGPC